MVKRNQWLQLVALVFFSGISTSAAGQDKAGSTGSGFIINRDGWIVTNEHVVRECDDISVKGYGSVLQTIVDRRNDIAAIRINDARSTEPLEFSRQDPRLGQSIIAFGYPLAGILSQSVKLTTGVINSLSGIDDDSRYLQISAAVQVGNSGGPLVDQHGNITGVVTGKINEAALQDRGVYTENINFALNASIVRQFLRANSIDHAIAESPSVSLSTEEIAEKVAPSTVLISCLGGTETATTFSESKTPSNREHLKRFAELAAFYEMHSDCRFLNKSNTIVVEDEYQRIIETASHDYSRVSLDVLIPDIKNRTIVRFSDNPFAICANVALRIFEEGYATGMDIPSFDCKRASTRTEIAICQNGALAVLDTMSANTYFYVRARQTGWRRKRILDNQRSWLKHRNRCQDHSRCLRTAYLNYLRDLYILN